MAILIYKLTCGISGKSYVGITARALDTRWFEHVARSRRDDRGSRLYAAMRKYGIDAFTREIIGSADTDEEARSLERAFIRQLGTFDNGYNSTDGGELLSPESLAKISKATKGRKAPWAINNWDRRRANGTANIDMRKHVPSGSHNPNAKRYRIRDASGKEQVVVGLKAFCRENGLTFKAMYDTMNGLQTHHKGFALLGYADSAALA